MQLLHWSTLHPTGPDNLAVVRFQQPVRVHSIRIFPRGFLPFERCPEVISETEPDAFFLDIFMNAQPDQASDRPKTWTQNTLAPTRLAYSGGLLDFRVGWSIQCTTRLVILKGPFQVLSLALYGTIPQLGVPPSVNGYEPSPLPQDLGTRPLTAALDPSANSDPTQLARSLLSLIPDDAAFPRPTIPLLLRLMFCLKAPDEDWDAQGFPYVFADIDSLNARSWRLAVKREDDEEEPVLLSDEDEEMDPDREDKSLRLDFLRRVAFVTTRPASDETPREVFNQVSSRIATAVRNEEENSPKEVASEISQILRNCASQHPAFMLSIMAHVSLATVFSSCDVLTEEVLSCLIDAAANPDLARGLSNLEFIALLRELCRLSNPSLDLPSTSTDADVSIAVPSESAGEIDQMEMGPRSPSISPVTIISPLSTSQPANSTNAQGPTVVEPPVPKVASLMASKVQQKLAMDLLELLATQSLLDDGMSNTRAQFTLCMDAVWRSLGSSEAVIGAWIENMIWEGVKQEGGGDAECRMGKALREIPVVPGVRIQSWGKVFQSILNTSHRKLREAATKWKGIGEVDVKDDEDVGVELRITHAEFIAFLRAYIGVGCVVGVFAWADSCPDTSCRQRALEIIRVWQNVEGYKQITKHFLLLPQMVKRLECNTSGYKTPRPAGVLSEKILAAVISDPDALSFHRPVIDNVLKLGKRDQDDDGSRTVEDEEVPRPDLTYIPSQTLLELQKMALVADDGLPGALDELKFFASEKREWDKAAVLADISGLTASNTDAGAEMDVDKKEGTVEEPVAGRKPISLRRLRTLRVAISVLTHEIKRISEEREGSPKQGSAQTLHRVLGALRQEEGYGLCFILADLVEVTSEDLADQFKPLKPGPEPLSTIGIRPPVISATTTEQLLLANRDALVLMNSLMSIGLCPPMATRTIRSLVVAIADTYISADALLRTLGHRSDHAGIEGSWWASGTDGDLGGAAGAGAGVYAAATAVRKACTVFMRALNSAKAVSGRETSVVVIKALLQAGELCARGWRFRDPGLSLTQICHLIDEMIPLAHEGDSSLMQANAPSESLSQAHWATTVLPLALMELQAFLRLVDLENRLHLTRRLVAIDNDTVGIGPWLVSEELQCTTSMIRALKPRVDLSPDSPHRVQHLLCLHKSGQTLQYIFALINDPSTSWIWDWLGSSGEQDVSLPLRNFLEALIECHLTSPLCLQLVRILSNASDTLNPSLNMGFIDLLYLLRNIQSSRPVPLDSQAILSRIKVLPSSSLTTHLLRQELGRTFMAYADPESVLEKITLETSESILAIWEWMLEQGNPEFTIIIGMTNIRYNRLCDRMYQLLPYARSDILHEVRSQFTIEEPLDGVPSTLQRLPATVKLSVHDIELLAQPQEFEVPKTPERHTPDVLGPIVSPPAALLRSPAATGLTKTYLNNDFRQLRAIPTSRQNTSRLPSMHVDEFETSPLVMPTPMPGLPSSLANLANFE